MSNPEHIDFDELRESLKHTNEELKLQIIDEVEFEFHPSIKTEASEEK